MEKMSYLCSRFRERKCKQEKHCDIVLAFEFAKFKKEDGAFVLSLDCVCYICSIFFRRENCSHNPVPSKVFGDT